MSRKALWGIAVGAAVVAGAFAVQGYPTVGQGSEGAVGAATRYRAQQIARSDVALGDTSAQPFLQSETFARLVGDEGASALLSDTRFRASLSRARLTEALGDPEVAKVLAHPEAVKVLATPAFQSALKDPGFKAALQDARFAEAMGCIPCPKWECGSNSPIVDGAAIAGPVYEKAAVRRYRAPQLANPKVVIGDMNAASAAAAPAAVTPDNPAGLKAQTGATSPPVKPSFNAAMRDPRFAEAHGIDGSNSPIVDGAAIRTPQVRARAARRYQADLPANRDAMSTDERASQVSHDVGKPASENIVSKAQAHPDHSSVRMHDGFMATLQAERFGEGSGRSLNSPIVDGAAIAGRPTYERAVRRYQAPQLADQDVVLGDGSVAPMHAPRPSDAAPWTTRKGGASRWR